MMKEFLKKHGFVLGLIISLIGHLCFLLIANSDPQSEKAIIKERKKVIVKLVTRPKKEKPKKVAVEKPPQKKPEKIKKAKLKSKKFVKAKVKAKTKPSTPKKKQKKPVQKGFTADINSTIDLGTISIPAMEAGGNLIADASNTNLEKGKKKDQRILVADKKVEEVEYVTKMPSLISQPPKELMRANYPSEAKKLGAEADVKLEILIDENGKVIRVKVKNKTEFGFAAVAKKLIRKYRFRPALKNDEKVAVWIPWTYKFRIEI